MEKDFDTQVSGYDDATLLKLLNTPYELEKEEYEVIIMEVYERKLISKQEFDEYFSGIEREDGSVSFESEPDYTNEESENDEEDELSDDPNDYWKCPGCGELIENTFDACWKCQNEQPELIQRPNVQEVLESKRIKTAPNFVKSGLSSMGISGVGLIISYILRYEPGESRYVWWLFGMVLLSIGFLIGFGLLMKGFFGKDKKPDYDRP